MARFEEVFEDTQTMFDTFISQIDSLREVNIKIIAQNNLKEIGKVSKASDLNKHMHSYDIVILLNEAVFEALDEEQRLMVIEELIAQVYFDAEKEKVSIIKPDLTTFSLLLDKFGYDKYKRLRESIKAVLSQNEETQVENNQ
jgi:hypothetical protein